MRHSSPWKVHQGRMLKVRTNSPVKTWRATAKKQYRPSPIKEALGGDLLSVITSVVGFFTWYRKEAPEWTRSAAWFISGFGTMCAFSRSKRGTRRRGCCLAPMKTLMGHDDDDDEGNGAAPHSHRPGTRQASNTEAEEYNQGTLCCAKRVLLPTKRPMQRKPRQRKVSFSDEVREETRTAAMGAAGGTREDGGIED